MISLLLAATLAAAPVVEYDADWFDAARNRHVPVHFYAPATITSPLPVIIFSHGLGNSRIGYRYLGEFWASRGYLSVHPEHLGANEEVTKHGLLHLYRAGYDKTNYRNLPLDIHFVIDQLERGTELPASLRGRVDTSSIAVSGHSIGAYAALAVGGMRVRLPDGTVANYRDPRVKAAIPISMSENFNASSYRDIAIPMLHITGTCDSSVLYGTLPRKRRVPFNSIDRADQYLLVIRGANHSTFSDPESPATRASHDAIRVATATFLDAYLRDGPVARASLRNGTTAAELASVAKWSVKTPQLRVGKINVSTEPLFNAAEVHGGFYGFANTLAIPTQEALIRRFLLFDEGQPYDPALLRESERNLRALDFLKSASVTAGRTHDGVVDINVTSQDAFTTDINGDFSNDGGRSLYDIDVTQKDLLGRGIEADVRTAQFRERRTNSIELIDPVAFGRYFSADLLLAKSSDGHDIRFAAARPLIARTIRETTDFTIDHLARNERLYRRGVVTDMFAQQHRALTAMEGFVLQARPALMTRFLAGIDVTHDTFQPLTGLTPAARDFRFVEAGFDATSLLFATLSHVDYGLKEQDFPLGYHGNVIAGRSRGGVSRVRTEQAYGRALAPKVLVLTALTASTRFGPVNHNTLFAADARYIAQFASRLPQTLVVRARADAAYQPDRDIQFFADGQNGLRAYPNFSLAGTHRVVVNAEDRWYLGREWLELVEPGAAVFIDSGNATDAGMFRGGLHTDFGAGLRFSIARFESAVLRFDVAYAANSTPLNRRGIVVSFATTQAF